MTDRKRKKITYIATDDGISKVERALVRFGIDTKENFAKSMNMSRSTLVKFQGKKGIQLDSFKKICEKVDLDWQDVADISQKILKTLDFSILEIVDDCDRVQVVMTKVTVKDRSNNIVKAVMILEGDFESAFNLDIFRSILRKHLEIGDSIEITNMKPGSIKLFLKGYLEDIEILLSLVKSGKLSNLGGFPIQDIKILSETSDNGSDIGQLNNKWYLVKEIIDRPNQNRDLKNIDLSDSDLSGVYMREADLSGADLSGADLSGANLNRAYLIGTDLIEADLSGSDLIEANLRGADLSRADLNRADMRGANLSGADLSGADLNRAYLIGTDLSDSNLSGTCLIKANLTGAVLIRTDLSRANLNRANLIEADLSEANLENAIVDNALFGNNKGINLDLQRDLEIRGAIFGDKLPVLVSRQ